MKILLTPTPRLAWLITGVGLFLILADIPFSYLSRAVDLPPDFDLYLWPVNLIYSLASLAFVLVGGLIATRQPHNAYGWVMLAAGFGQSLLSFWTGYGTYAFHVAPEPPPMANLSFVLPSAGWMMWVCSLPLLMLLYPTGKLRSPRWKPVIWILAGAFLVAASASWLTNVSYGWIAIDSPYALTGRGQQIVGALVFGAVIIVILLIPISGLSLIVRAYRSTGIERLQYKWFAFAVAILVFELLVDFFWEPPQPWEGLKETLPLVFLAVAIGLAVLRYRLFDIDVLIRKTAVYTLLTAVLVLVYFGAVILLQALVGQATDEQSPLIIVLSTLLIAALFTPLRRRVQALIDRRFFRKKYDAQQILAQFSRTARDEVGMEVLTAELARVIQETMQPEHASVWLNDQTQARNGR